MAKRNFNNTTPPAPQGTFPVIFQEDDERNVSAYVDLDGAIIVPPGGVLALLNTTSCTTFSATGRLLWEEVPV